MAFINFDEWSSLLALVVAVFGTIIGSYGNGT
jgi:hypothetical protein